MLYKEINQTVHAFPGLSCLRESSLSTLTGQNVLAGTLLGSGLCSAVIPCAARARSRAAIQAAVLAQRALGGAAVP